jgi:hypothetical protein
LIIIASVIILLICLLSREQNSIRLLFGYDVANGMELPKRTIIRLSEAKVDRALRRELLKFCIIATMQQ